MRENAALAESDALPLGRVIVSDTSDIVIIGAGPVGVHFAHEYLKRNPQSRVTLLGNEPYTPYNRVRLSQVLAREISVEDTETALPNDSVYEGFRYQVATARAIDLEKKCVRCEQGEIFPYASLAIATGARAHVPNIPGIDLEGVLTFRNRHDVERLFTRINRSRHTVVVGGGLLGLETARAVCRFNTKVTLIQQGPYLMNRQLDPKAASLLQKDLEKLDIQLIIDAGVRGILGSQRVEGVITRDKQHLECDTVIVCAGIRPNMEIARNSGIAVGRGIKIDEQLQTSCSDIYAIGECAEFRGATFGLVNPGFEHAAILADRLSGGSAFYRGSLPASRLKVVGTSICSMGDPNASSRHRLHSFHYEDPKHRVYRKIVTEKGRLIGAIGVGDWPESRRVQTHIEKQRWLYPWELLAFWITGNLTPWAREGIQNWPADAIVCQCNGITRSALSSAVSAGATSIAKLSACTKAGTVCGSCVPLLGDLCEDDALPKPESFRVPLLIFSLLALIVAAAIFGVPGLAVSDSVITTPAFEKIWNDKFFKQVTGFSVLGLSVIGLLVSLRKRWKRFSLGAYAGWRTLHTFTGLTAVTLLIAHTGFHIGSNLNRVLITVFLLAICLGAFSSIAHASKHRLALSVTGSRWFTWAHIAATWPLPVLIVWHILTVYFY